MLPGQKVLDILYAVAIFCYLRNGGFCSMSFRQSFRALLATALTLFIAALNGQTQLGQIVGRVTDSSGAAVYGAVVEVVSPAASVRAQVQSNAEGLFTLPYMQYGSYTVNVTAAGFSKYTLTAVAVAMATTTTINPVLVVEGSAEQITISASALTLDSSSTMVSTSIEEKLKSSVPNLISGGKRSAVSFVDLSPGFSGRAGIIAGGRDNSHESLIDGQTVATRSRFFDYRPGLVGNLPSVESIGEYKMISNSMPAEYGRSSGGMTTFATKSGANQFHGAAYHYLRNHRLDARPWQAAVRDVRKQNEFGITGGGPLVIPTLYDGHNKTFFWANFTGYKLRTAAASRILSVPTAAMRNGDFSASDINPIYDHNDLFSNASGTPERRRLIFDGRTNVMNPARISPVSRYFLDTLPLPSRPGSFFNYVGSARSIKDDWDISVKPDHYLSGNSRLSGFYQFTHFNADNGNVLGDFFGATGTTYMHRTRLDWAHNIRPNLINQVLVGFTRWYDNLAKNNFGQNVGFAAGLRGTYDGNCPEILVGGSSNIAICQGSAANIKGNLTSTFNETLMWNHRAHNIKMGLQIIRWNENFNNRGSATGAYSFTEGGSANTNSTGGNYWASFLLGYPTGVSMTAPTVLGVRQTYFALFVQDDWRVSRKLTINAGLRWDVNVPYKELHGQITGVDLNRPNPGAGNLPGALVFYGDGPGRTGYDRPGKVHWNNFGPRLGLAYQIDKNTVFRAFGGIIYQGAQNGNAENADRTGFIGGGSPVANSTPFGLYYSWDRPYPQEVLGTIPNTNPAFRNGQSYTFQSESGIGVAPALYQWSGGLQHELKGGILIEGTYFANNGKHGVDRMPLGVLEPKYWGLGALLNRPLNSPEVRAAGFSAPYAGFNESLPLFRAIRPYPQFDGLVDNANAWTSSTYHAFILKMQKRFSSGLTFLTHFTGSKNLTSWSSASPSALPRDPYNLSLSKGLARRDVPRRYVATFAYELPFGPGKRFGSTSGRTGKVLLSGWTLSGTQQYSGGTPANLSGTLGIAIPTVDTRADRVAGVPVRSKIGCGELEFGNPAKNYIWNAGNPAQAARFNRPIAFQSAGDYGFGNAPSVDPQARQCGMWDENISLTKIFTVHDSVRVRIGIDGYNMLNRHTWITIAEGSDSINSATFGQIQPYQGSIGVTGGGPRQLQLSLRVEF